MPDNPHRDSSMTRTTRLRWAALAVTTLAARASAQPPGAQTSTPFVGVFDIVGAQPPAPGGRCPVLTVSIVGAPGTVTPFGPATTTQSHCIDPTGANPFAFTEGIFTFTFASGDTFFGTYGGTLAPTGPTSPIFDIFGTALITGGTGFFAGATGGGPATGTQNFATGDVHLVVTGTITTGATTAPEPRTMLLVASGLALVGAARRRGLG
jgi:hypothetical protein